MHHQNNTKTPTQPNTTMMNEHEAASREKNSRVPQRQQWLVLSSASASSSSSSSSLASSPTASHEQQRNVETSRRQSSTFQLELEAASYFKLDPSQMSMLSPNKSSMVNRTSTNNQQNRQHSDNKQTGSSTRHKQTSREARMKSQVSPRSIPTEVSGMIGNNCQYRCCCLQCQQATQCKHSLAQGANTTNTTTTTAKAELNRDRKSSSSIGGKIPASGSIGNTSNSSNKRINVSSSNESEQKCLQIASPNGTLSRSKASNDNQDCHKHCKCNHQHFNHSDYHHHHHHRHHHHHHHLDRQSLAHGRNRSRSPSNKPSQSRERSTKIQTSQQPQSQIHSRQITSSSTNTTNSLPSVSSSPSVSPSLICPHMTLDDILHLRNNLASCSPHTIGLCARCRLDPPPNVHSPLSPLFKPCRNLPTALFDEEDNKNNHHHSATIGSRTTRSPPIPNRISPTKSMTTTTSDARLRRGYSDHQASYGSKKKHLGSTRTGGGGGGDDYMGLTNRKVRDDSLDYYLEPQEMRRLQMSPTLRNSVEFIRTHSIESGRVIRVYKNGCPYDKPLRICILRGEFASLTHLLDYINGRQLIPLGARYLFHLDGQLVYSVHELKHGSVYVVSGTRQYDSRTSTVLKEMLDRERQQQQHQSHHSSNNDLCSYPEDKSMQQENSNDAYSMMRAGPTSSVKPPPVEQASTNQQLAATTKPTGPQLVMPVQKNTTKQRTNQLAGPQARLTSETQSRPSAATTGRGTVAKRRSNPSSAHRVGISRAKSELSGLLVDRNRANKQKKMVTFMDTGRGSSPMSSANGDVNGGPQAGFDQLRGASSNLELTTEDTQGASAVIREINTNEIGIQVSESIDGFLIDLPMELPAKGDDSNIRRSTYSSQRNYRPANNRHKSSNTTGVQAGGSSAAATRSAAGGGGGGGSRPAGGRAPTTTGGLGSSPRRNKQIVTITERQLSLDEINQLRDLDHGNHHGQIKPQVTILLEPAGDAPDSTDDEIETTEANQTKAGTVSMITDERNGDPQTNDPIVVTSGHEDFNGSRLISATTEMSGNENEPDEDDDIFDKPRPASGRAPGEHWQYPGGRDPSATPTERPVSQSEANESVMARVTTPTPSLSTTTGGDSLNYATELSSIEMKQLHQRERKMALARPKQRVEVMGSMHGGLYEPTRNFRLVWVNGFTINDQYPENSFSNQQQAAIEQHQQQMLGGEQVHISSRASTPTGGVAGGGGSLSPSYNALMKANNLNMWDSIQFKPSDRFHNWMCYSRLHDELMYPAGSLVVLWCRWTNEQRYYSKHTTCVSTITLSTLDLNLAASAQVCDAIVVGLPAGMRTGATAKLSGVQGAQIHLWSLTTLETLYVIDDDQLRTKKIFSLKLRNSITAGCELSVCARDDRQVYLATFSGKHLVIGSGTDNNNKQQTNDTDQSKESMNEKRPNDEVKVGQKLLICVLRSAKTIQNNQIPLLMIPVVQQADQVNPVNSDTKRISDKSSQEQQQQQLLPLILFGRRHFNLWAPERRQQKFRLLQSENRSVQFVDLISKANCMARLSPCEFLLGDMDGNVALVIVKYRASSTSMQKRSIQLAKMADASDNTKYNVETINLIGPRAMDAQDIKGKNNSSNTTNRAMAITCLTRITGSLFACADTSCTIRFYRIKREICKDEASNDDDNNISRQPDIVRLVMTDDKQMTKFSCQMIKSLTLPPDLGFVCSLVLANFSWKQSIVEFYVVSTSNTILFGSLKLPDEELKKPMDKQPTTGETNNIQQPIEPMESLSVVYEGHETAASSLVADSKTLSKEKQHEAHQTSANDSMRIQNGGDSFYYTCSLDCRICKWDGKRLIWKSMLPSSCASLAIHPIGFVLAIGSIDGTVYILDKISGLLISYFPLTPVCINCLAYSRDGALLAAGCANGSIFILPVYERGLKYKKVSIFQSPHPVVSLQFSTDNRYILTSVTHSSWQELILWDVPNFRYMRDNVKVTADKIEWFDSICSGSEDVRAIWENANLANNETISLGAGQQQPQRRTNTSPLRLNPNINGKSQTPSPGGFVVNLSCHRLIKSPTSAKTNNQQHLMTFDEQSIEPSLNNFVIASDTRGYLRLFRYPCYDIQQGFYAIRVSSLPVNCCRFLNSEQGNYFVSTSYDGTICLWVLE